VTNACRIRHLVYRFAAGEATVYLFSDKTSHRNEFLSY